MSRNRGWRTQHMLHTKKLLRFIWELEPPNPSPLGTPELVMLAVLAMVN